MRNKNRRWPFGWSARSRLYLELLEDRTLLSNSNLPAILLLDPSGKGALNVTGNGGVLVTGGGPIVIDSNNSQAALLTGKSSVSAAEFEISGTPGYLTTGSGKLQGIIDSGVASSADPLAALPVPQVPTTTYAAVNYSGANPLTLSPGTYVGGIRVTGQGSITLLPGIYYLQGGGLSVTGQGGVTGNGVMIYNAPRSVGDSINFTGNGDVQLTPPSTGTYQNITIFQDRTSSAPINLTGKGNLNVTGTIYAAHAKLNITGNGGVSAPSAPSAINEDILYDLNVTGNGGVVADTSYNQALTLTISVSPGPKSLPNGTPVTNVPQSIIAGTTKAGAQIALETGSDGLFDNGHTTADASGHFSLPVTLAAGLNVLQVRATSRFDQQVIASNRVTLDTVPPTITGSPAPAANANGWNNTSVVVSFLASDNVAVASVTAPVTLRNEGVGQSVTGTATDVAGNSVSTTVSGINIDLTKPTTTATLSGLVGPGGWYRSAVAASVGATDNLSGVQMTDYALDNGATQLYSGPITVSGDGTHTLSYWSIDNAGNEATHHSQTIQIDTVPPMVAITSPASGLLTNHNFTIVGKATDTLSGLATLQVQVDAGTFTNASFDPSGNYSFVTALPLDNSVDGAHTLYVRGTDQAGNFTTANLTFTLDTIPPITPVFDLSSGSITPASHQTAAARVTLVGHTDPNVTVTLVQTGATTLSSNMGVFQFPSVVLTIGDNPFTVQAQDAAGNVSSYSQAITRTAATVQPNAVIVWNQATLNAIQTDGTDPLMSSRALAMVQAAVYDVVNNVEGTPAYYTKVAAPADASIDAAVDAAAHDVLSYLYPAQQVTFDALLTSQLALLPAGQGTADGETVGQAVGNAIIALRANDGAKNFVDFTPGTAPGDWQPTAPSYAPALDPQGATMTPWAMTSPTQFDPAGPPALTSQQWADAVNQVKSLGVVNSTTRTAAQTTLAQFWNDGVGTYTPSGHWNQIAQTVAEQEGDSLADDARLFAELNVSMADAGIATWNTKYLYDTWRPITVIQSGGGGVNPAVTADPTWTSLLTNPNFPEYVSGHSAFSMSAATVLDSFFGANVPFTTTEQTTTLSATYTSFDQAAQDAGMSRLYGGIHFLFSIQDGWTVGQKVATWDLATFNFSKDTTPPKVTLNNVLPSGASHTNVTVTGQVTDNLSGVANLQVQVDGGVYVPLSFDATTGSFSYTTSFAVNGSADGAHTIDFKATDAAGNVAAPVPFTFTLDTQAPVLSLTSPTNGGALADGTLLSGTVTTGAPLVCLCYAFDGSTTMMPVVFNADGSFSQALDLSKLAAGSHTLTVTAQDAAGNTTTQTLHLSMAAPIALTVTSLTPTAGATEVGVTFRPKVTFSRPINRTTLTTSDFYATDPTGAVLPATVVASNDGTYAWLYFTGALPSATTITLIIDGSTIKAADGSLLDAAGNGTAGSRLTSTFSTVNEAPVPGTTLSGILADPGPDLKPGTRDDVRAGPDGVLGTADDIYLRPIEGVEVYILGAQNQAVYTDVQGRFSFTSVPTGDVKLALVGNVPGVMVYDADRQQFVDPTSEGFYFPEMVMDLTIRPGVPNTVMGTMGTRDEEAANATNLGVYLPRVQSAILQTVSNTQPTTVGVPAQAAPDLTPEQRQHLTLTIQPNTAIDANGQVMNNVQIGISTVPTSLIKDMLPAGMTVPPFTITVQAPGVATFTAPVTLTFPNVTNAAPGTKLLFMSFDHTTGRLEVEGTATVSADGQSVVTDPDSGLTHPGWHFVASGSLNQDRVYPNGDKVGQLVNDPTKADFNDPVELMKEYPNDVDPQTHTLTTAAFNTALTNVASGRAALIVASDSLALAEFDHFIDPSKPPADNAAVRDELANDANFIYLDQQLQAELKKEVLANKNAGDVSINLTPFLLTVPVDGENAAFIPTGPRFSLVPQIFSDAKNIWGRIQAVNVSGEGDITPDGNDITGQLQYTFSIEYGFGQNDASRGLFTGNVFSAARELQLAGIFHPFPLSVTITVDIRPGDPLVAPAAAVTPTMSTSPGFGNDPSIYYRFDFANGFAILGKTDSLGQFGNLVFPPNTQYTGTFYSPSTNTWGSIIGQSGASGEVFGFDGPKSTINLNHFGGVDSTGDGLPDVARYVIGLKVGVRSFAGDGIDDATKLAEGLNPLSGIAFPTGVVATLPMPGTVEKLAVDGNRIYAAAGSGGLAVVDGTQFNNPIMLGRLSLPGYASGIGVDGNLQIAAVATGSALQLVDVSNGMTPKLLHSVAVPASQVVVADGLAYVASGSSFSVVDLESGNVIQSLTLPMPTVTGLTRDGSFLYAYGGNTLAVIDVTTEGAARVRGHLSVSIATTDVGVFAANGIVWLAGSGLRTVNVSNPDAPTLIHGADFTFTARRVALNGSGLGVLAPAGNSYIEVYDTSNPNVTANRLLQIPLSAGASDVAISRGIAYVGENGQLQVVNYLPFDNKGVPPAVSISTSAPDVDLLTPGLQVLEGSTLPIQVGASDDVQVAKVDLLVNGQVVQSDVAYPFDFFAVAPTIAQSGSTFTIQVQATDTGGNVGLSNVLTIGLESDTSPPTISSFAPANGSSLVEGPQTVRVTFSKAIDTTTATATNFQVLDANNNVVAASNIQVRDSDRLVQLTFPLLTAGSYQLVINGSAVTDRVGHPLSTGNVTDSFTLTPRETLTVSNADADRVTPGLQLYEGTTIHGTVTVVTGVSVQEVDILLNGQVVASGTAAPLSFSGIAPLLSAGASTFTLQARVIDTSGTATVSSLLNVGLLKDVTPPTIVSTSPVNGGTATQGLQAVNVNFSKPLARSSVTAANFQLLQAGPGGLFSNAVVIPITSVQFQNDDTQVVLATAPLVAGTYRLQVNETGITDRVGNALGSGTFTSTFTLQNVTVINFDPGPDPHFTYGGINFTGSVSTGSGYDNVRAFTGRNIVAFNPFATSPSDFRWAGGGPTFDLASFTIAGAWGSQTLLIQGMQGGVVKFSASLAVTIHPVVFTPNWSGIDDLRINIGTDYVHDPSTVGNGQQWALANLTIGVSLQGQPEFFAGIPKASAGDTSDLTKEQLQPVVVQAIADLATAGYDVSALSQVHFVLVSLPDSLLGLTDQNTIWIDQNAQGYGWYTDVSPSSSAAFTQITGTNEVQAAPGSPAYGHVDLLTVVTHELGHVLGFASIDAGLLGHGWMTATLGTGVRRYPDVVAGHELPAALDVQVLTTSYSSPAQRVTTPGGVLSVIAAPLSSNLNFVLDGGSNPVSPISLVGATISENASEPIVAWISPGLPPVSHAPDETVAPLFQLSGLILAQLDLPLADSDMRPSVFELPNSTVSLLLLGQSLVFNLGSRRAVSDSASFPERREDTSPSYLALKPSDSEVLATDSGLAEGEHARGSNGRPETAETASLDLAFSSLEWLEGLR